MSTNDQRLELPDVRFFGQNRRQFPAEQLIPYEGLYVAWSPDGTRILASAEDRAGLREKLREAGIHFSQVVFDYIDRPDISLL